MIEKIYKSEDEWRKILTPEQYSVLREKATEKPNSCAWLHQEIEEGIFHCAACNLPLFASGTKFKSGTGWPSYFEPINDEHIEYVEDHSHGMLRTEVRCARCESHLGHIFDDGPPPTYKRYCINSISLKFEPQKMNEDKKQLETIVLGGGCFWCLEAVFERVRGVEQVVSGYAGGEHADPNYEKVSSGSTGHAETVKITFDPQVISLEDILHIFFTIHDPTTFNRQGEDVGPQYRSIILYQNQIQHEIAEKVMREFAEAHIHEGFIVTELKKLNKFFPAEDYHQQYYTKNPNAAYCQLVVNPKVAKFRENFKQFLK